MTHSLTKLQTDFITALSGPSHKILASIHSTDRLSAQDRFAIYQNSMRGTALKRLKNIYPVCAKIVGDDFFQWMVNKYFTYEDHHGENFATFIKNFSPAESVPYLCDVAKLEWYYHIIYYAVDFIPGQHFSFNEESIFTLHPSANLLFSIYPVHLIWEMNVNPEQDCVVEVKEDKYYYFIYRHFYERRIVTLNFIDWQILKWVQEKVNFYHLCEKILEQFPEINICESIARLFKNHWLAYS
jgi:hypothetical protein